jgi:hypothetical protein
MTFVDNIGNPAKEFTVDANFGFRVRFITPNALESSLQVRAGDVISGRVTETEPGTIWNEDLTGVAAQMTASNPVIDGAMPTIQVVISLAYTKAEGVITEVTVALEGAGVAAIAQTLMGGTYIRK